MKSKYILLITFIFLTYVSWSQNKSLEFSNKISDTTKADPSAILASKQFASTSDFIDAAINSVNSFNSLIKKENYRIKITSFNNPTSSDLGFSLENEIQTALKPLLTKAKNTNTTKFSQIISTIVNTQSKMPVAKTALTAANPIFTTLISLVGNLTIQERRITTADLDSFIQSTSKYFVQYEKLNQANILFDQNIEKLNSRMKDLQFDIKEYILDMVTILYNNMQRTQLKNSNTEELFLKYLEKDKLELIFDENRQKAIFHYPTDGIKAAKDIANNLQKLFNEYQKVYGDNYQQIRGILSESKAIGKNINTRQVDASMKELEELFNDSNNSDILGLRVSTLLERLEALAATEQNPGIKK